MRFSDKIKIKPTLPFKFNDEDHLVKNISMKEYDDLMKKLQIILTGVKSEDISDEELNKLESTTQDTMLYMLKDLLLDTDGNPYDDFKDTTWEELEKSFPASVIQELITEMLMTLRGKPTGN